MHGMQCTAADTPCQHTCTVYDVHTISAGSVCYIEYYVLYACSEHV